MVVETESAEKGDVVPMPTLPPALLTTNLFVPTVRPPANVLVAVVVVAVKYEASTLETKRPAPFTSKRYVGGLADPIPTFPFASIIIEYAVCAPATSLPKYKMPAVSDKYEPTLFAESWSMSDGNAPVNLRLLFQPLKLVLPLSTISTWASAGSTLTRSDF